MLVALMVIMIIIVLRVLLRLLLLRFELLVLGERPVRLVLVMLSALRVFCKYEKKASPYIMRYGNEMRYQLTGAYKNLTLMLQ